MVIKKSRLLLVIVLISTISLITGKYLIKYVKINRISYIEFTKFEYLSSQTNITKTLKFEEKEYMKKIIAGLNDRKIILSKIDIRARDYKVLIVYKDGKNQEFSLWINDITNGRGILMQGNKTWYLNSNSFFIEILK